jgi:hypothetical protein
MMRGALCKSARKSSGTVSVLFPNGYCIVTLSAAQCFCAKARDQENMDVERTNRMDLATAGEA